MNNDNFNPMVVKVFNHSTGNDYCIGFVEIDVLECYKHSKEWTIDDYFELKTSGMKTSTSVGKVYMQIKWIQGSGFFDGETPTPKGDITQLIKENNINGTMVCKINSFEIAKLVRSYIEPYIEIEFPNGRICKSTTFPNILAKCFSMEYHMQKLFLQKSDAKNVKIRLYNYDPMNGDNQQLIASGTITDTNKCYDSPGEWAVVTNLTLETDKNIKLQKSSDKTKIRISLKYALDGTEILTSEDNDDFQDDKESKRLKKIQQAYLDETIHGRLRFTISHAKDLTSPDGTNKAVNLPYVSFQLYDQIIETEPWEEEPYLNPIYDVYEMIDIEAPRKNLTNINLEIFDAYQDLNRFMGCCKIPMKILFAKPGAWTINGYQNLVEKDANLNLKKGSHEVEHKYSLGKVYVQLKWIPNGFKDNQQDAPIVEHNKS